MGGLISWYALCEYPEVFGSAACLSTHWIGTFNENTLIPGAFASYLEENLPAANSHKIYFDHGTEGLDGMYGAAQKRVDAVMEAKGYDDEHWRSIVFDGTNHSENAWKARLFIPMQFMMEEQELVEN